MSAVLWAPNKPKHWDGASLRWVADIFAGGTPDKGNLGYWTDGTIPWLNSGSVGDWIINEPSMYITKDAYSNSSAKWIPSRSVVIALAGQGKTKGTAARLEIDSTCNQSMAAIVPSNSLDYRFLQFWLASNYQNIRNLAGGDKRDGLNLAHIGGIQVPLPPVDEQRSISDYLDRETQKIDELITEQRGLIETLKERRRSVVSKTLDGTTNSVKLKYILSRGRPLTYGIVQAGPPVDEGVPYIGPSDIVNHQVVGLRELRKTSPMVEMAYKRSRVQRGDVVVSIGPAYGKTTMIPVELAGANLTQDTARVSCDAAKASPRYVQWVLMSDSAHEFWNSRIMGATFRRLNLDVLAQTPIPLPSIGEQCDIAAYLDEQTSRIDVLISESEDLIALSQERRAALITAAVTGQIDVRTTA